MNLKHPYEKHLAEKLVQVPPPGDPDQNWQQMKSLLDKDMPRGGGGILGAARWLVPGIIIVAILTGVWFGGKQYLPIEWNNKSMAGTISKTKNNKAAKSTPAAKTEEQIIAPAVPGTTEANKAVEATSVHNAPAVTTSETSRPNSSETNSNELVAGTGPAAVSSNDPGSPSARQALPVEPKKLNRGRDDTHPPAVTAGKKTIQPETTSPPNNNEITADRKKIYANESNRRKNNNRRPNPSVKEAVNETIPDPVLAAAEEEEEKRFVSLPSVHIPKPSVRSDKKALVKESPVDIIVDYTGSSVIVPSGVLQKHYTYYSQADLFPEMVVQKRSSGRKSGRSYESRDDKAFAIGLSLPLGFPLGDQEPLAYNRHAGVNTISDYIPSPHLQYHINSRTYFQTLVQMWSPQFIRPILLYQTVQSTPQPNTFIYHSVYARKLYYFNLPVSVYHSPMRNFYMGTGLQYSAMLSGVALFEDRKRSMVGPPEDYILYRKYARFANDSLSNRFNSHEVRLLLDMNYYRNRFIVGLQYNQAFNNFVSFRVNSFSPYTFDKNKSLQFYLRYNIWDDRKRKRKSETLLSLK